MVVHPNGANAFRTLAVASVLATTILPISPALAVEPVLYVNNQSTTCSNTGTGSATTPYCTITAAATVAVAGQTVQVASGSYVEQVTPKNSGTSSAPIVYTTAPGASVTISGKTNGFYVSGKSWLTIRGFKTTSTTGSGIRVSSSSNLRIQGNEVSYSGTPTSDKLAKGIAMSGLKDSLVIGNIAHHNTDAGIALTNSSSGVRITGNESYANARQYVRAATGIDLRNSSGNTVDGNKLHDNEDSGLNIWTSSNNTVAYNNIVYRNGDHGIDVKDAQNARVLSNTVYKNVDSGIEATNSTGAVLANNISTDNGINSPRTSGNIRADSTSAGSATLDYDVVYLSTPGIMIDWAGVKYSSLEAFKKAVGKESRGIEANPLFVDVATNNFELAAASPAVDSANASIANHPSTDAYGRARVDVLAVTNTGTGVRPYDDRGALEQQ